LELCEFDRPLKGESNQQEALTIIRSLIDRIEITPGEKRGDPQMQLVGGLAAILERAISGQQKTAIQKDSGVALWHATSLVGCGGRICSRPYN
tara:strand:+ start:12934 stop:13212 length:279 start_codon:yes stop_codon:yes gene_type:complete